MSDQPTEKHEFKPRGGWSKFCEYVNPDDSYCNLTAAAHQPSAVAPEQATPRPWRYEIEHHWLVGGPDDETIFHIADDSTSPNEANAELIVLAVNNYEAQAVRIRELEDALNGLRASRVRRDSEPCWCPLSHLTELTTVEETGEHDLACAAARAALKPKEGK